MSDASALGIAAGADARFGPRRGRTHVEQPIPVASATPSIHAWIPILRRLGVWPSQAVELARRAGRNGTDLLAELLAAGIVPEETIYREIAADLALPFQTEIDPRSLRIGAAAALILLRAPRGAGMVQATDRNGRIVYLVAPSASEVVRLRRLRAGDPAMPFRVRVVAPAALRAALIAVARPRLVGLARDGLFVRRPLLSARIVANAWQGVLLGAMIVGLPLAFLRFPTEAWLLSHLFFSLFFLACIALRLAAAAGRNPQPVRSFPPIDPASVPIYTVLVALRDEVEIVPELLVALGRLSWPRSKLDVKLVCEADDRATIDAIRAHGLRSWVEVIEVPPGMPRTKPNALSYALPMAKGEFVVLYDAEDRPHPHQLVEAWQRFRSDGPDLGCLQAPIRIDNAASGMLPAMFALEYAALFRRLLPYLARQRWLLPLGGTSNHFRRAVLEEVGGWDPYNVTEDADLGMRLARFGYRTATLTLPTGEDAPDTPLVWLRQRTRWFKGWSQTWLVHMRDPRRLARELGFRSFLVAQILFAGMIISALAHPFLIVSGIWFAVSWLDGGLGGMQKSILALDLANIVLGYAAFLFLGWRALGASGRGQFGKIVLFTPVYWLIMSVAAWRALVQLYVDPHRWEKTPHKRRRQPRGP
ncbi:MAG: glycosyltransferase [Mesorhizobium sp.]|nr:glycosyltransferase [Mesorhizobium sp.]